MNRCLVGVGSNLGNPHDTLDKCFEFFQSHFPSARKSRWFSYPAVGGPDGQGDFLNGCILLETSISPEDVAAILKEAESGAGRERHARWSARTLDCDLLLYEDSILNLPELTVPHPRMVTRRFVLEPANEIAREMLHPVIGWTIEQLFNHLSTPSFFIVAGRDSEFVELIGNAVQENFDIERRSVVLGVEESVGTTYEEVVGPTLVQAVGEVRDLKECLKNLTAVPKLVLVAEPQDSEFGRQLCAEPLHLPVVFLSSNPSHAVQDAVGAVLSMR